MASYYKYQNSSYYRPSLFGGFRYFPPVIRYLLISNVGLYFLSGFLEYFSVHGTSFGPYLEMFFYLFPIGKGFEPWQLVTYMFMHGSIMHLLFNMFALWMFGMELENTWGSKKFLLYYMLCGIGAGITNLLIGPLFGGAAPTIGASGAIYGVLLAFGVIFPDRPIFIYFLLPIRAKYFVMLYIALELYSGVTGTADGVAHFAHLGGAVVGLIFILIDGGLVPVKELFRREPRRMANPEPAIRYSSVREEVSDAKFYDLHPDDDRVSQEKIDEILDKISQNGYQSLTDEEKRILFDASKKLN